MSLIVQNLSTPGLTAAVEANLAEEIQEIFSEPETTGDEQIEQCI